VIPRVGSARCGPVMLGITYMHMVCLCFYYGSLLCDTRPSLVITSGQALAHDVQSMQAAHSQRPCLLFHQDTQRSDDHLGTLIICLPVPHDGGNLIVSHEGNEQVQSTAYLSTCNLHSQCMAVHSNNNAWATSKIHAAHAVGRII
jgi:hypothetical protein